MSRGKHHLKVTFVMVCRKKTCIKVPMYLNFRVNKAQLAGSLLPAILDGSYLERRPAQSDKIMIEYSQPNTHKAMHVGHARCAALGDSLVRMFEWIGHNRDLFLINYTQIGSSLKMSTELQTEHAAFAMNAMVRDR